jgi:Leucine-rich repeat (LRR) protein
MVKGQAMREKLEKRIVERPKDLKRHQDYANWLKNNDDPLGDLVEFQIGIEKQSNREKRFELELKERKLLAQYGREWIGELAGYVMWQPDGDDYKLKPGCKVWWFRGWVYGIQIDELTLKLSKVLLQAKELRLFTKLVLTDPVNASCDYLHEWGLLDKVKELDLSYGRITDKGALTLAADRSLRKLKSLDMTGNQLTEEGLTAITKSYPRVGVQDQNPIIIRRDDAVEWEQTTAKGKVDK